MFMLKFPELSKSKWTKSGPALDRLAVGLLNDMLAGVAKIGLVELQFDLSVIIVPSNAGGGVGLIQPQQVMKMQ